MRVDACRSMYELCHQGFHVCPVRAPSSAQWAGRAGQNDPTCELLHVGIIAIVHEHKRRLGFQLIDERLK